MTPEEGGGNQRDSENFGASRCDRKLGHYVSAGVLVPIRDETNRK